MKKFILPPIVLVAFLSLTQSCQTVNPYEVTEQCQVVKPAQKSKNTVVIRAVGVPPKREDGQATKGIVRRRTQACEGALLCAQKNMADYLLKQQGISEEGTQTYIKGGTIASKEFDEFNNCYINFQIELK